MHSDRTQTSSCLGMKKRGRDFKGAGGNAGPGDHYLDYADGVTDIYTYGLLKPGNYPTIPCKYVQFIVCQLQFNKTV